MKTTLCAAAIFIFPWVIPFILLVGLSETIVGSLAILIIPPLMFGIIYTIFKNKKVKSYALDNEKIIKVEYPEIKW